MDALIIRHLGDIEQAAKRVDFDLDPEVFTAIDKAAKHWAEAHGWSGEFEFEHGLWTAPGSWKFGSGKEDWFAYFELTGGADDGFNPTERREDDYFWLSRLCRAGNGMLGFRWKSIHFAEGRKARWRSFVRERAERIVRETGLDFEEKGSSFFLPFTVEREALARAIEEDAIEDALGPFQAALDRLLASQAAFDGLIEEAKSQFAPPA